MLYYAEFIKRGTWVCVQDIINHSDKCLLRERRVALCDIQIHPGVSDRREIKLVKRKTSGLHFSHYNLMKINDHSREQCRVQNKHRGVYILEFILCHKSLQILWFNETATRTNCEGLPGDTIMQEILKKYAKYTSMAC